MLDKLRESNSSLTGGSVLSGSIRKERGEGQREEWLPAIKLAQRSRLNVGSGEDIISPRLPPNSIAFRRWGVTVAMKLTSKLLDFISLCNKIGDSGNLRLVISIIGIVLIVSVVHWFVRLYRLVRVIFLARSFITFLLHDEIILNLRVLWKLAKTLLGDVDVRITWMIDPEILKPHANGGASNSRVLSKLLLHTWLAAGGSSDGWPDNDNVELA
jgi:hypothetical protein